VEELELAEERLKTEAIEGGIREAVWARSRSLLLGDPPDLPPSPASDPLPRPRVVIAGQILSSSEFPGSAARISLDSGGGIR
jgi:hypothetical protein